MDDATIPVTAGTGAGRQDRVAGLEHAISAARTRLAARDPGGALMCLVDGFQASLAPEADGRIRQLGAAELVVAEQIADLAAILGHWQAAGSVLTGIEVAARSAGALEGADYAVLKHAHIAVLRGDLDAARETLASLAPRVGALDDVDFSQAGLLAWERSIQWHALDRDSRALLLSRAYLVISLMLLDLGQYPAASCTIKRGLVAVAAASPDSVAADAEPHLALARARLLLETGALAQAGAELRDLAGRLDPGSAMGLHVARLELDARLAQISGQLGLALETHDEICRFCENSGFATAALTARLNRAHIRIALNQTRAAEAELEAAERMVSGAALPIPHLQAASTHRIDALRKAIARRREGGGDHLALAPSVRAMLSVTRRRAGPKTSPGARDVVAAANAVTAIETASGDVWVRFEARANALDAQLSEGDREGALASIDHIRSVFASVQSPLLAARLTLLDGVAAELRAEPDQAMRCYRMAARDLAALGARLDLWRAQRSALALAIRHPDLATTSGTTTDELVAASDATLAALADSLHPESRAIFLLDKADAGEAAIGAEIETLLKAEAEAAAAPWYRRWSARRHVEAAARHMIMRLDRDRQPRARAGSIAAPSASAPDGGATLVFVSLPNQLFAALLTRSRIVWKVAAASRLAVRDLLAEWHLSAQLEAGSGSSGVATASVLARLADMIALPELIERMGPRHVQRLRIVADDVLHGAPFAAMPVGGEPLVRMSALSFASAIAPGPRAVRDETIGRVPALLVGVGQAGGTFAPLPNAASEAEAVAAWLGELGGFEPRVLVDAAVDTEGIKRELQTCGFAHIVCHGAFDIADLSRSGLVLEPDRDPPRLLSIAELAGSDLSRLRHVTMSACWAADNYILPGRRVISLPVSLAQAGAGSILAAMWKVSDEFAPAFMHRFYALAARGSKAKALAQVQRECIDGRLPGGPAGIRSSPYLWAGFALYGEGADMPIGRKRSGPWRWV